MQLACQPQPIEMKRRESAESGTMLDKMTNDEQETAGRDATIESGSLLLELVGPQQAEPQGPMEWPGVRVWELR